MDHHTVRDVGLRIEFYFYLPEEALQFAFLRGKDDRMTVLLHGKTLLSSPEIPFDALFDEHQEPSDLFVHVPFIAIYLPYEGLRRGIFPPQVIRRTIDEFSFAALRFGKSADCLSCTKCAVKEAIINKRFTIGSFGHLFILSFIHFIIYTFYQLATQ